MIFSLVEIKLICLRKVKFIFTKSRYARQVYYKYELFPKMIHDYSLLHCQITPFISNVSIKVRSRLHQGWTVDSHLSLGGDKFHRSDPGHLSLPGAWCGRFMAQKTYFPRAADIERGRTDMTLFTYLTIPHYRFPTCQLGTIYRNTSYFLCQH